MARYRVRNLKSLGLSGDDGEGHKEKSAFRRMLVYVNDIGGERTAGAGQREHKRRACQQEGCSRSQRRTARSDARVKRHRHGLYIHALQLGMTGLSAEVGGTWARWWAEQRSVERVSARHE